MHIKPDLRVGFVDYFTWFDDFFTDVLNTRFNVIRDDANPQVLLFCDETFGKQNLNYNTDNVIKVFYTGENRRPWNYRCHFALTFDHIENFQHYRFPLYALEDWVFQNKFGLSSITELKRTVDMKEKTDFCGFVSSNGANPIRNNMFHMLNAYKKVHSGGPLFNNIGHVLPREETAQIHKMNFFKSKKFSLCYENDSYPGYVTEKLYHGFYMNTIPIYWGSPVVEVDYNTKAFINRHDFDSDDDMLKRIIEIDNNDDLYQEIMAEPIFNKENKFMSLDRLADFFVNNVYRSLRK